MKPLVHNPFFWFGMYYLFSSIVSGMPAPDDKSSLGYKWLYTTLHTLAGNVATALRASGKLPSNGDTMKSFIIFVALLFLAPFVSRAQTPTPSPTPNPCSSQAIDAGTAEANCAVHFITGSAFYQLSNGKQATEFDVRLPLTSRVSGFAAVFAIPDAKGSITVAGGEYRERLNHLFGKAASSSNLNLSKIEIFGRVGLGSEINSINSQRAFAYSGEGGFEFPIATVAGGPVVKTGVRIGYIGVVGYGRAPEHFILGSNTAVSPQVTISF